MFEPILVFFIVLAVLVLAHEFGHFISAKKYGVKVEEFGFGFPPRLFSFKKGETLYSFNLFPLGGFVKILGENGEDSDDPGNFASRPAFQKAVMLSAGVFFNLVLAVIIFSLPFINFGALQQRLAAAGAEELPFSHACAALNAG